MLNDYLNLKEVFIKYNIFSNSATVKRLFMGVSLTSQRGYFNDDTIMKIEQQLLLKMNKNVKWNVNFFSIIFIYNKTIFSKNLEFYISAK